MSRILIIRARLLITPVLAYRDIRMPTTVRLTMLAKTVPHVSTVDSVLKQMPALITNVLAETSSPALNVKLSSLAAAAHASTAEFAQTQLIILRTPVLVVTISLDPSAKPPNHAAPALAKTLALAPTTRTLANTLANVHQPPESRMALPLLYTTTLAQFVRRLCLVVATLASMPEPALTPPITQSTLVRVLWMDWARRFGLVMSVKPSPSVVQTLVQITKLVVQRSPLMTTFALVSWATLALIASSLRLVCPTLVRTADFVVT